ncbi:MAG: hypothetical protein VR78_05550 [Hoeflea sp. BRH_c9]|nr:MAG: hypothetical protein VR78_05550 [Hoeflea sp. BRH_c9]
MIRTGVGCKINRAGKKAHRGHGRIRFAAPHLRRCPSCQSSTPPPMTPVLPPATGFRWANTRA